MKDLFVLTADANAQAVMRVVLSRPKDLGIRPLQFEVDRHVGRDSGMVKDGPELIRMKLRKGDFRKVGGSGAVLRQGHRQEAW